MYSDVAALLQRIDAHRIRELLVDFANIPSPSGQTAIAAEWYAGCLRAAGAVEVQLVRDWHDAPSVVAGFPGTRRSPTLEFNGHLDTRDHPVRRAFADNGRVFGRGVAGGKAGLIAVAEAARVLVQAGPLPGGGLVVVAHSRHEAPSGDAHDLVRLIERGFVGDAVVIASGDHAVAPVAAPGVGTFRVVFFGNGSDSSTMVPDRRATHGALDAAYAFTTYLRRRHAALARHADPDGIAESVIISRVDAGQPLDQPAARCSVDGIWRWLPERALWEVTAELNALAYKVASAHCVQVEVSVVPVREGYRRDRDDTLLKSLRTAHRAVAGYDLPLGCGVAGSDTAVFLRNAGVQAVCHGVDTATSHGDHESVAIEDLVTLTKVYLCLALDYLSSAAQVHTEPHTRVPVMQETRAVAQVVGGAGA